VNQCTAAETPWTFHTLESRVGGGETVEAFVMEIRRHTMTRTRRALEMPVISTGVTSAPSIRISFGGPVRHGYPWVLTDQAHRRPRQVGPAYQKTRRPVSRPNRPGWRPTRPSEDLPEDCLDDLVHHDLKTWCKRQDISGFRPKKIDRIWQDV
jgi:hypothetical protein